MPALIILVFKENIKKSSIIISIKNYPFPSLYVSLAHDAFYSIFF